MKFVAADMPEANEMVVGIMALVAQAERRMISERTKAALQAAKARAVKLGNPTGTSARVAIRRAAGPAASQTTAAMAQAFAERSASGARTARQACRRNAAGQGARRAAASPRPNGGKWTARCGASTCVAAAKGLTLPGHRADCRLAAAALLIAAVTILPASPFNGPRGFAR